MVTNTFEISDFCNGALSEMPVAPALVAAGVQELRLYCDDIEPSLERLQENVLRVYRLMSIEIVRLFLEGQVISNSHVNAGVDELIAMNEAQRRRYFYEATATFMRECGANICGCHIDCLPSADRDQDEGDADFADTENPYANDFIAVNVYAAMRAELMEQGLGHQAEGSSALHKRR